MEVLEAFLRRQEQGKYVYLHWYLTALEVFISVFVPEKMINGLKVRKGYYGIPQKSSLENQLLS